MTTYEQTIDTGLEAPLLCISIIMAFVLVSILVWLTERFMEM